MDERKEQDFAQEQEVAGQMESGSGMQETQTGETSVDDRAETSQVEQEGQKTPGEDIAGKQLTELVEISGKNGEKLDVLTELFHEKIETDTHKNQLFDQMYSQLKKYQDDVLDSLQEPLIKDLLSLLDGIKQFERFMPEEATQENYEKLRKRFGDFREDLEDILEDLDVCRYDTDPVVPDPKRQKIVKTIVTEDADKNNTVEKKISDGYLYRNRILKYEKISIYKYNEKTEEV